MSTNPLTLTTELEAVNLMLRAIGESPVHTLEDPTHSDAASALTILRHWNMMIQSEGWRFNSRNNVLLTRDGSNYIAAPANTLHLSAAGVTAAEAIAFRNGKVFNIEDDSFEWEKDLYVNLILLFDFADIPQIARQAITQAAGLEFIGDEASAESRAQFSQTRAAMSMAQLRRAEGRIRKPNIFTDSGSTLKFFTIRKPLLG